MGLFYDLCSRTDGLPAGAFPGTVGETVMVTVDVDLPTEWIPRRPGHRLVFPLV